jgi:hypothetical protein
MLLGGDAAVAKLEAQLAFAEVQWDIALWRPSSGQRSRQDRRKIRQGIRFRLRQASAYRLTETRSLAGEQNGEQTSSDIGLCRAMSSD